MNQITFGSACSGIEAASVAWHELGWRAAWLAEIETAPSQVLAHHYPDVPNLGDMNRIPQLLRNGEIVPPDVLCGGTPCQAFSVAGLRNSLDDARGNLSLKFCDIANEIDIQRAAAGLLPCIVKWENVPGVLSTKDNAFGCFLGQLAGEDCALVPSGGKWSNAGAVFGPQRAIAWRILDAQYFGLAQRRRRVFVVASARNGFDPAAVLFESEGVRRDSAPSRSAGKEIAAGTLRSTDGGCDVDHARAGHLQPVVGALTTRCGEATQNEVDSHMLVTVMAHGQAGAEIAYDRSPTLTCVHEAPIAVYQRPVAHAFDARQSDVIQYGEFTGPLDTLGSTIGLLTSAEFSRTSGAVCVTGDITHTLKAEGFDASEDGTGRGRGQPIVNVPMGCDGTIDGPVPPLMARSSRGGAQTLSPGHQTDGHMIGVGMAVRRLTPRECERLQGFPDDYTLIPLPSRRKDVDPGKLERDYIKYLMRGGVRTFDECMRVMADGPRYKALGNSWAVPVVRWIGRRIDAALRTQALGAA